MTAPQPDAAIQDLINLAAAGEALARLMHVPPYFGNYEGRELQRLFPILARTTIAATKRALRIQPSPAVVEVQAPVVDDLLARVANMSLREARRCFETAYMAAQVVRAKGNVTACAAAVKMERSALHRKLVKLGIVGTIKREHGSAEG